MSRQTGIDSKKCVSRLTMCAATVALAVAFTAAPSIVPIGSMDDAAYAQGKSGDKGNKGGGGRDKGDRGGRDKGDKGSRDKGSRDKGGRDKADRGNRGGNFFDNLFGKKTKKVVVKKAPAKKVAKAPATSVAPKAKAKTANLDATGLHPSQKKALNAKPAPQAIANMIEKQKWNGIVGQMAKMDLLARAATDLDNLTEADIAALESLGIDAEQLVSAEDFANEQLAGDGYPADAEFEVIRDEDGAIVEVTCTNCDALDLGDETQAELEERALADVQDYAEGQEESLAALESEYKAAEETLLDRTKQDWSEEDGYAALDGVADHLGVERPQDLTDYKSPEDMTDGEDGTEEVTEDLTDGDDVTDDSEETADAGDTDGTEDGEEELVVLTE